MTTVLPELERLSKLVEEGAIVTRGELHVALLRAILELRKLNSNTTLQYIADKHRHLVCLPYSEENLHRMAEELMIKSHWFHRDPYAHYDIPKKRKEEIEGLCTVVSSRNIVEICRGTLVCL